MEKYAIVSVYDKTGLDSFASFLAGRGIKILSTGGTASYLKSKNIDVISVSDYTGYPEILDGRVKSLHPKIHGGILARRSLQKDREDLKRIEASEIDFVVVNLYPFTKEVAAIEEEKRIDHGSLVELIDIGGPTLIRAAAKNFNDVVVISDPADYETVQKQLSENGEVPLAERRRLAGKVFATMSRYDAAIARYLGLEEKLLDQEGRPQKFAQYESVMLEKKMELRYGENPHQEASLYGAFGTTARPMWSQLQGKELSYNNLVDMEAAAELFMDLRSCFPSKHAAVIIKHTNPCGTALRSTPLDAFRDARNCDPLSAFGGIVAVSGTLDAQLASSILEGFVEVVLSQEINEEARRLFSQKKNVRLIQCDFDRLSAARDAGRVTIRPFWNGYLMQTADNQVKLIGPENVVVGKDSAKQYIDDLNFAFVVCKHVKSNAIVVVKSGQAIGVGAGQMSRVDSSRLAIERAKHHGFEVKGAVAASDAFLPFTDTLEVLNDAGVAALVQPGGSLKDDEVKACAEKRGVVMALTGERHFRH